MFNVKFIPDTFSEHANFKILLGSMPPDTPRMSCCAAELLSATTMYSY